MTEEEKKTYFVWLEKLVRHEKGMDILLLRLFDTPFYWDKETNPLDKNRAEDGKKLRLIFCQETGESMDALDILPCSVLEMLVGLAKRMDEELLRDPEEGDRIWYWFDIMLDHLNLLSFTDALFFEGGWTEEMVDARVIKWMHRRYGRNGIGSLFPLRSGISWQEKMDIWMQMNQWIIENQIV